MQSVDDLSSTDGQRLVVWRFTDGKSGHESQTQGLLEALGRRLTLEVYSIESLSKAQVLLCKLRGGISQLDGLSKPDLILGAGHRTHLSVLTAKALYGGRSIVLMKPSLPMSQFDACLIPQHDGVKSAANMIETIGVLNPVRPAANASHTKGLILIGGPSSHFDWDASAITETVREIVERDRSIDWTLTTSRRTPETSERAFVDLNEPNLTVVPVSETERGWVARQLDVCKSVWVSEDSVSMVFEAVSAGARVGLLSVPAKREGSRVQASVDSLRKLNQVVDFPEELNLTDAVQLPALQEADRCAEILIERFSLLSG